MKPLADHCRAAAHVCRDELGGGDRDAGGDRYVDRDVRLLALRGFLAFAVYAAGVAVHAPEAVLDSCHLEGGKRNAHARWALRRRGVETGCKSPSDYGEP